ncbi:hypothetical protein IWZ00DRAFT_490187 [Phyllosticta capitalensis]
MPFRPPARAYFNYRRYPDHNGRAALSVWLHHQRPSLPPLFSFQAGTERLAFPSSGLTERPQVYITYDVSAAQESDIETLASQLFDGIFGDWDFGSKRLDLHFMDPGASTADCIQRHRALVATETNELANVVVPSYISHENQWYHSFIIVVSSPEWQHDGVTYALFDCTATDPKFPVQEKHLPVARARQLCARLYGALEWREEYEEMFQRAQDLGMTEW